MASSNAWGTLGHKLQTLAEAYLDACEEYRMGDLDAEAEARAHDHVCGEGMLVSECEASMA